MKLNRHPKSRLKTVLVVFLGSNRSKYLRHASQHWTGFQLVIGLERFSSRIYKRIEFIVVYKVLGFMLRECFGDWFFGFFLWDLLGFVEGVCVGIWVKEWVGVGFFEEGVFGRLIKLGGY